jgi:hypothetical protein
MKSQSLKDLAMQGRLPWYTEDGKPKNCYVIGVAGNTQLWHSPILAFVNHL